MRRRSESDQTEASAAREERAAQEYFSYFEQHSDEPDARSERMGARSRRLIGNSP